MAAYPTILRPVGPVLLMLLLVTDRRLPPVGSQAMPFLMLILVPVGGGGETNLAGRYRGETNLHLAGKYVPPRYHNHPAVRSVAPDVPPGDVPAAVPVAARASVEPVAADENLCGGSIEERGLLGGRVAADQCDPPVPDPVKLNPDHEEECPEDPLSARKPAAHHPEHEEECPDVPPAAAPPSVVAPSRCDQPRYERSSEVCISTAAPD